MAVVGSVPQVIVHLAMLVQMERAYARQRPALPKTRTAALFPMVAAAVLPAVIVRDTRHAVVGVPRTCAGVHLRRALRRAKTVAQSQTVVDLTLPAARAPVIRHAEAAEQ